MLCAIWKSHVHSFLLAPPPFDTGQLWYKHRWGFGGGSVDLTDIRVTMTKVDGGGPFSFSIYTGAGTQQAGRTT